MAIYVDPIRRHDSGMWCHMMTDGTTEELVDFALSIGLNHEWIQRPGECYEHFDLRPAMRSKAIRAGAVELSSMQLVMKCVRTKRLIQP